MEILKAILSVMKDSPPNAAIRKCDVEKALELLKAPAPAPSPAPANPPA
ncbi:MAG: hypothetical protein WC822_05775 [Candidatus Paceibacterota bacterium]|jgi:hypothetical protein